MTAHTASAPTAGARRVLMVAYHFPPLAGSSGIQRTLRFAQQLPAHGWQPLVLSADTRAYERTSDDLLAELPADLVVRRAFALDTARQLALGGRYLASWARPDRWQSWRFDAVRQGMAMIRRYRPQAIWSTYPIATAHLIGAELQRRSGLPWIADFRDPMAQEGYPADPLTWQTYADIERAAAQRARCCTYTTPSALHTYRQRYPDAAARMHLIENGYDEDSFAQAESGLGERPPLNPGCTTLLHSGLVYPSERDPSQLLAALGQLHREQPVLAQRLRLRFRAAVHDALLHQLAAQHGVSALVEVLPPVPYAQALREMLCADGLLILQASNCNEQVPAKLYEYLRAGRPIVCLSDPAGDTWATLQASGLQRMARLDDAAAIVPLLADCAGAPAAAHGLIPSADAVRAAARTARTAQLAQLLQSCAAAAGA